MISLRRNTALVLLLALFLFNAISSAFRSSQFIGVSRREVTGSSSGLLRLQMNVFEDAFRFFTNLDKEASAKHILMTSADAPEKLAIVKKELEAVPPGDLSTAFSELATKVKSFKHISFFLSFMFGLFGVGESMSFRCSRRQSRDLQAWNDGEGVRSSLFREGSGKGSWSSEDTVRISFDSDHSTLSRQRKSRRKDLSESDPSYHSQYQHQLHLTAAREKPL